MRLHRLFKYPRSAAEFIKNSVNRIAAWTYSPPTVLSIDETILEIIRNNCSVSRYGDGELNLMVGRGTGFQSFSAELASRLRQIISSEEQRLLICIPDVFAGLEKYRAETRAYWRKHLLEHRLAWYKLLNMQRAYYNAFISRCYYCWADKSRSGDWFAMMKKVWKQRDVVLVEGEKSRIGVGNDLFDNVRSMTRILAPAENAFSKYREILSEVRARDNASLVLVALGPTATVLVYDLHRMGYQAVDIGHIDVEYEWYRCKTATKMKIDHKYVNEVADGRVVCDVLDHRYLQQIATKIV